MLPGTLQEAEFFGKEAELTDLFRRVLQAEKGLARSAVLSGPRGIGKTELLKQLFGHLFWKQDSVVPFYYTINPALLSAEAFSKSYLTQFLCQRLAFERKEQSLLYLDSISIDGLSALAEEREALWVREILDAFDRSDDDPLDALRIALNAPRQSVLTTGRPVAVLIDDFHRLKDLAIEGTPDSRLIALFEAPMSSRKTPHVMTGNTPEVQEMPVSSGLERIPVQPLGAEDASSKVLSLLRAHESEGNMPPLLLRHLGGNPFYLECVVTTVCAKKNPEDKDFWNAYIREVMQGALSLSWLAVLKSFFPDLGMRRIALAITYKIYHTAEPLSCERIAKSFALTESQAKNATHALYLAGFIRGEFGVFRAVEDRVLRDIIDCFYMREILAKPSHDLERDFLERLLPQKENAVRFDITLPMVKEAELVAAQCLEQIGKNLQLDQDTIGQLQIAVIEACINAMEHSKGIEKKVYVGISTEGDRLEVSIESAGQEFIVQETGEPFGDRESSKAAGRGWGIKLMKRFADKVKFEKTARGTKIVLVKKLGKSAGVQREDTANRE
ncbi:MAG: ATP-binding protein [Betaproteobacteria bacterium]